MLLVKLKVVTSLNIALALLLYCYKEEISYY